MTPRGRLTCVFPYVRPGRCSTGSRSGMRQDSHRLSLMLAHERRKALSVGASGRQPGGSHTREVTASPRSLAAPLYGGAGSSDGGSRAEGTTTPPPPGSSIASADGTRAGEGRARQRRRRAGRARRPPAASGLGRGRHRRRRAAGVSGAHRCSSARSGYGRRRRAVAAIVGAATAVESVKAQKRRAAARARQVLRTDLAEARSAGHSHPSVGGDGPATAARARLEPSARHPRASLPDAPHRRPRRAAAFSSLPRRGDRRLDDPGRPRRSRTSTPSSSPRRPPRARSASTRAAARPLRALRLRARARLDTARRSCAIHDPKRQRTAYMALQVEHLQRTELRRLLVLAAALGGDPPPGCRRGPLARPGRVRVGEVAAAPALRPRTELQGFAPIISACWEHTADQRPTMAQVVERCTRSRPRSPGRRAPRSHERRGPRSPLPDPLPRVPQPLPPPPRCEALYKRLPVPDPSPAALLLALAPSGVLRCHTSRNSENSRALWRRARVS